MSAGATRPNRTSTRQYTADPEALKRLESISNWLGAARDSEYNFGVDTFRPYDAEMVESNRELIPYNTELMKGRFQQGIDDISGAQPIRSELRSQQLEGLGASRPVIGKYFDQASTGVDVGKRRSEAVAGIEHQFSSAMPQYARNLSRRGLSMGSGDLRSMMIEKAKAKAGASTFAGNQAEAENFGRLGQAIGTRQAFTNPTLDNTAYAQGSENLGGYQMQNALDRAGNLTSAQIQANAPGAQSRTRTKSGGGFSWTSSQRYKKEPRLFELDDNVVENIEVDRFQYKDSDIEHIGFIAEKLEKVIPEAVYYNDEGLVDGINLVEITAVLMKEVQTMKMREKKTEEKMNDMQESLMHLLEINSFDERL